MRLEHHLGLFSGLHGMSLKELDSETKAFIHQLVSSADKTGYRIIRLSLPKNSRLRLIFAGDQYPDPNASFENMIVPLLDPEDKVFADCSLEAERLREDLHMPVGLSGLSDDAAEAYRSQRGIKSVPQEVYLQKIVSTLKEQLECTDGRLYQQLYFYKTLVNAPRIRTHPTAGQSIKVNSHSPDLVSMLNEVDAGYAILVPQREKIKTVAKDLYEKVIEETAERE